MKAMFGPAGDGMHWRLDLWALLYAVLQPGNNYLEY